LSGRGGITRRFAPRPRLDQPRAVVAALRRSFASVAGSGRTVRVLVRLFTAQTKKPQLALGLFCLSGGERGIRTQYVSSLLLPTQLYTVYHPYHAVYPYLFFTIFSTDFRQFSAGSVRDRKMNESIQSFFSFLKTILSSNKFTFGFLVLFTYAAFFATSPAEEINKNLYTLITNGGFYLFLSIFIYSVADEKIIPYIKLHREETERENLSPSQKEILIEASQKSSGLSFSEYIFDNDIDPTNFHSDFEVLIKKGHVINHRFDSKVYLTSEGRMAVAGAECNTVIELTQEHHIA